MRRFLLPLAILALVTMGSVRAEIRNLSWSELRPDIPVPENPFNKMSGRQMDDLRILAQYREQKSLNESQTKKRDAAQARLEAEGIDIKAMFDLREQVEQEYRNYATLTNTQLAGKAYRMPGFVTPIEFDGDKVVQFFLVPTPGACVHTPPPAPNQLVLVDYPEGLELDSIITPFWVTGVLQSKTTSARVAYKDGQTAVDSSYSMSASSIELYEIK